MVLVMGSFVFSFFFSFIFYSFHLLDTAIYKINPLNKFTLQQLFLYNWSNAMIGVIIANYFARQILFTGLKTNLRQSKLSYFFHSTRDFAWFAAFFLFRFFQTMTLVVGTYPSYLWYKEAFFIHLFTLLIFISKEDNHLKQHYKFPFYLSIVKTLFFVLLSAIIAFCMQQYFSEKNREIVKHSFYYKNIELPTSSYYEEVEPHNCYEVIYYNNEVLHLNGKPIFSQNKFVDSSSYFIKKFAYHPVYYCDKNTPIYELEKISYISHDRFDIAIKNQFNWNNYEVICQHFYCVHYAGDNIPESIKTDFLPPPPPPSPLIENNQRYIGDIPLMQITIFLDSLYLYNHLISEENLIDSINQIPSQKIIVAISHQKNMTVQDIFDLTDDINRKIVGEKTLQYFLHTYTYNQY